MNKEIWIGNILMWRLDSISDSFASIRAYEPNNMFTDKKYYVCEVGTPTLAG